ncbi:MAG: hypothetical protein GF308_17955 [Candidatus Heimdallarchaeota archaeon]|nr:hypothetical protein [Candidatus Heimdallarchaeota archaeon]
MVKCDYPDCENEVTLPFVCKFCGKTFCTKHRLPEKHDCEKLDLVISPLARDKSKSTTLLEKSDEEGQPKEKPRSSIDGLNHFNTWDKSNDSFYATGPDGQIFSVKPTRKKATDQIFLSIIGDSFSIGPEVVDILVGLLALIFSFGFTAVVISELPWIYAGFFVGIIALSFFGNIYSQKLLAKFFGYNSRYVLTKLGILLTLIMSISPIKFLRPGALVIPEHYLMSQKELGMIGAIGSVLNITMASIYIFLGWLLPFPQIAKLFLNGAFFCSQIALISLIPISGFSGKWVAKWNLPLLISLIIISIMIIIGSIILGVLGSPIF